MFFFCSVLFCLVFLNLLLKQQPPVVRGSTADPGLPTSKRYSLFPELVKSFKKNCDGQLISIFHFISLLL